MILTNRLILRTWKDSDLHPFIEMGKDPEVMRFFPNTLTEEETQANFQRIQIHFQTHGFGPYVLELKKNQEFIGFTGLFVLDFEASFAPCVEIGWRLKKQAWGFGYATEAAKECLQYGFNSLHLESIYSFTSILNTPSENVMKRIGMTQVGTFAHPKLESDHPLSKHLLYQIEKPL